MLAGERFAESPAVFAASESRLRAVGAVAHWGYAASREAYARLLASADVVISTAVHEFFGVSIVEAVAAGALPLCPARLAYPELLAPTAAETALVADLAGSRLPRLVAHEAAAEGEGPEWSFAARSPVKWEPRSEVGYQPQRRRSPFLYPVSPVVDATREAAEIARRLVEAAPHWAALRATKAGHPAVATSAPPGWVGEGLAEMPHLRARLQALVGDGACAADASGWLRAAFRRVLRVE
jgi:hypothetical protein